MTSLNQLVTQSTTESVRCLGHTFENEQARRAYFLEQLRERLQNSDFKKIAGFPIASDDAILALSDPPYYAACPNPWLTDFLNEWIETSSNQTSVSTDDAYHREPFAADVSEGKTDPIYNAHSYHTKVPHQAIMRYILHYTKPGDIVFDGFCGTGMTGVAAQLCGDKQAVEKLGYRVQPDGTIESPKVLENQSTFFKPFSKLGARRAILNDLSPAATFIAHYYNTPVDADEFEQQVQRILQQVEQECGWMYKTLHQSTKNIQEYADSIKAVVLGDKKCPEWMMLGDINYTVFSDVFICPECANELVFWQAALDKKAGKVQDKFHCPHCDAFLTKRTIKRAWLTQFDQALGKMVRQAKQVPVLINYSVGKNRYQKIPDEFDLALLDKIEKVPIPYWFPTDALPEGYNTKQPIESHGITHVHHFYTKRNLLALSCFKVALTSYSPALFVFSGIVNRATKMNRIHLKNFFFGGGGWNAGYLKGTLYVSSMPIETSIIDLIQNRLKSVKKAFLSLTGISYQRVATFSSSANVTGLKKESVDYIFLDPPFGANLMYSELNFLWESWLQVFTNNQPEAIVNKTQGKELGDYRVLMLDCFEEAFRILKPGRWMTVEFSNTKASVWNTIQTVLQQAGFIIANVSALDKKQGSFKAVTTTTAVKQDLIISAYKPNGGLQAQFQKHAGTETGVWEFIHNHLKYLPITKMNKGSFEFVVERDPRILYDRTIAYFISHGALVPLSSQAFQAGLRERFVEKEGMIFLPEQVGEYEQQRQQAQQPPQMELFVYDERSAIDWLQQFLKKHPATRQQIHPKFTQQLSAGWKKHEVVVELESLLEANFLKYNGLGSVPIQIHRFLENQYPDCRNLDSKAPLLQQRAADYWYVPDLRQASDLEKLREAQLLREFKQYQANKRLKKCRTEALRAGFKQAWIQQDYQSIIEMAEKLPETLLYQDEKLLQLYDLALVRLEAIG
jgi:DNA modification methylase